MAALQRVYAGPGDALYVSVGECAGTSSIVCVRARAPRRVACVCACVVRVVCRGPCPVPTPDAYSLWSLGAWLCVVDRIAQVSTYR